MLIDKKLAKHIRYAVLYGARPAHVARIVGCRPDVVERFQRRLTLLSNARRLKQLDVSERI